MAIFWHLMMSLVDASLLSYPIHNSQYLKTNDRVDSPAISPHLVWWIHAAPVQANKYLFWHTDCIIQLYEKALEYILWILPISGEAMNEMTF